MSAGNKLGIAVHFDLICPWCLIGKRQLERARARFAREFPEVVVETVWHPVSLLPDLPEEGVPFAEFYERRLGSSEAVRQRSAQVQRAAERVALDIDLAGVARMPNTARAHGLLRRVAALDDAALYEALLERLLAAHFRHGEDIGDEATLRKLAVEVGVPAASVDGPQRSVEPPPAAAIVGVPYFVFNNGISLSGAHDSEVLYTAMKLALQPVEAKPGRGSTAELREAIR